MIEKRYQYITDEDYEIAEKNGIKRNTAYARVWVMGWDIDRAITTKPKKQKDLQWEKWKDKSIVCYNTYASRMRNGMNARDAALTPFIDYDDRHKNKYGFTKEHFERAAKLGIDRKAVLQRYQKCGWDIEKCVSTPKMNKSEAAKAGVENRRKVREVNSVWK